MSAPETPIVIDQDPSSEKKSKTTNKKDNYVVSSDRRIRDIASSHGINAKLAKTDSDSSLLKRSLLRDKKLREQRQKNLETIIGYSYEYCQDETAGDPDQDWLYRFFDMAQDIHDSSMQKLWSQVLKQEVVTPGSTSLKALKVLKDMTQREAHTFQRAASLACSFGQDSSKKLLIGYKCSGKLTTLYKVDGPHLIQLGNFKLPYSSLLLLIELGLLLGTELESGEIDTEVALPLAYQGKHLTLLPTQKGARLIYYRFSPTGAELCKLLGNKPNNAYYDQVAALLSQRFIVQTDATSSIHHAV
ncbi:MAG: TIGR03899 family protein [Aliivibrio sp.]|uniref:TIGR03899 family protein n=1 Tax=Aliivibrio sp. TaxID=1872443 RepID=UPI001A55768A|nr:TIGR03899 family protein [Aliivibrio sp.]